MKKKPAKGKKPSPTPAVAERPPLLFPWERLCLALIVTVSLALSGTYLYQLHSTGLVNMNFETGIDSLTFHVRGISVSKGEVLWLKEKQALYPAIVGGLYALFGVKPLWVFVFQVLLLPLGCILLYALGKRIFHPAAGILAAGLWAVYPVSIFFSGLMVRAVLIT
ncbi:MAG: glycosyltransferase family 39 protein, partial [Deltaproteobacteria bacterium]|nr:glycosyltransferase family 39 protein [Deltaproteobacteria bacterium]